MSSIDKAFIKAYAKGSLEPQRPVVQPAPAAPAEVETWVAPDSDRYHRLETAHGLLGPHRQPPPDPIPAASGAPPWQSPGNRPLPYPGQDKPGSTARIDTAHPIPARHTDATLRSDAPSEPVTSSEIPAPVFEPMWVNLYSFDTATELSQADPQPSAAPLASPSADSSGAALAAGSTEDAPRTPEATADGPRPEASAGGSIEGADAPLASSGPQPATPFNPVWEVDAFGMPEVVERLQDRSRSTLLAAGEQLAGAVRDGLRVLAVTSPGRGQGRTTVSIQIAQAVAACGLRVALVDGDLDHPALADRLCLEIARGWFDALRDGLPLDEVAVQSIEEGITLLPLLRHAAGPRPTPSDPVVDSMLDRLTAEFDLVVIDSGHVNTVGGALLGTGPGGRVDAALLVCDARHTASEDASATAERLRRLGIEHIGVVENFCGD